MAAPPSDPAIRVLLIEDDERLAQLTARYLAHHGVEVRHEADGVRGLAEALHNRHDLILLDLMLPGLDGLAVCHELRARCDVPIIIVTAHGEEADRVLGLESGADDYVAKPFSSRELLARVRAQVRRARGRVGPTRRVLQAGRLTMDPSTLGVSVDGVACSLTSHEFALLYALAGRAGRVIGREQLLELVHGNAEQAFDRAIDVQISRLRRKLGDDPARPQILLTVRGAGYMVAGKEGG